MNGEIQYKRMKVKTYWGISTGYKIIQDNIIIGVILPYEAILPRTYYHTFSYGENRIIPYTKYFLVIPNTKEKSWCAFVSAIIITFSTRGSPTGTFLFCSLSY